MAKREAQSSQELMVGDLSPLTSPFASKMPRKADLADAAPLPSEGKPRICRKRKRSESPEKKENEAEDEDVHQACSSVPVPETPESPPLPHNPNYEITDCLEMLTNKYCSLEIQARNFRHAGTFTVTPYIPKNPIGTIPKPESESESDDEEDDSNSNGGWDEDDSNEEDNWRNDYPDDDDNRVKRDSDDDGDSD